MLARVSLVSGRDTSKIMVAGSRVAIFALALAAAAAAWPVNDRMKTMFETALDEDANGAMSVEELRSFVSRIEDTASTKDVLPLFRMVTPPCHGQLPRFYSL